MRKGKSIIKRSMAYLLSSSLVLGMVPGMPANAEEAKNDEASALSVTAFADKEQLMTGFDISRASYDRNERDKNIGKLDFGRNTDGENQIWYILGADEGVAGDNTILYATSPITWDVVFEEDILTNTDIRPDGVVNTYKTDSSLWEDCTYPEGVTITEVYPNHYGASDLRVKIKELQEDTEVFSEAEYDLMNSTEISTEDTLADVDYITKDKLYAPFSARDNSVEASNREIYVGSKNQKEIYTLYIGDYTDYKISWARDAVSDEYYERGDMASGIAPPSTALHFTNEELAIQPATNLNLDSVLFASAVRAATVASPEKSGVLAADTAMTLRLDGRKTISSGIKSSADTIILDMVSGETVNLVVQGNNGTDDWYYSKKIEGDGEVTISAADVNEAVDAISAAPDFTECKVWIEQTKNRLNYAKAVGEKLKTVTDIEINVDVPVAGDEFDLDVDCNTPGVDVTIEWPTEDEKAVYNEEYTAKVTITPDDSSIFGDDVKINFNGQEVEAELDENGNLTFDYTFPPAPKKVVTDVTVTIPTGGAFTGEYTGDNVLNSSELPQYAEIVLADGTVIKVPIDWSLVDEYKSGSGVENIYKWILDMSGLENFDFDANGLETSGTVAIKNKTTETNTNNGSNTNGAVTNSAINITNITNITTNSSITSGTTIYATMKEVEKLIYSTNTDKKDVSGSVFHELRLQATGQKKAVKLTWKKMKKADGYIIYGAKCGKKMEKIKEVASSKKTHTVKKLKKGTYYKYIVVAYKLVDGKKVALSTSKTVHVTTKGGKFGNPKKVTHAKKITLKKGKKKSLKAKLKVTKKMKAHIAKFRYESKNPKIAKVNKKGKVTAKKKGSCKIFIYAQNGVYKQVTVKVKK